MMKKLMVAAVLGMTCAIGALEAVKAEVSTGIQFSRANNIPSINLYLVYEADGVAIPDSDSALFSSYFKGAVKSLRYRGSSKPYSSNDTTTRLQFCSPVADLQTRLIDGGKTAEYTIVAQNQFLLDDPFDDDEEDQPPTPTGVYVNGTQASLDMNVQPGTAFYKFTLDLSNISPRDRLQYVADLKFIVENSYNDPTKFTSEEFLAKAFEVYLRLPGGLSQSPQPVDSTDIGATDPCT
jgi:hypothetical protein